MAENSNIEWTDHTFNPWRGCVKVHEGCANCYAEALSKRNPRTLGIWGPNGVRVRGTADYWNEPKRWNDAAAAEGCRARVFCASLADVFEEWSGEVRDPNGKPSVIEIDHDFKRPAELDDLRHDLFRLIDATPNLDWLLLTKRPENIREMWPAYFPGGYIAEAGSMNQEGPRPNVWLGTSISLQEHADAQIIELLECQDLAPVLFVSIEPLLGPIDLFNERRDYLSDIRRKGGPLIGKGLDWVIVGGESGPNARPMHPDWVRDLQQQCEAAGVPFFFKQWGEWLPIDRPWEQDSPKPLAQAERWMNLKGGHGFHGDEVWRMRRVGKKRAGRVLAGAEFSQYPAN